MKNFWPLRWISWTANTRPASRSFAGSTRRECTSKISGGKVLDSRTRQVVNRVADALRLAAQSAGRTETCLGIFYRRKQAHLGAPKATTATARKLACLIYQLLRNKRPYQEPDPVTYQLRLQKSALTRLQKQAASLGYTLLPTALVPA